MKQLELISVPIAREVPGTPDQVKVLGVAGTFRLIPFNAVLRRCVVTDLIRSDSGSVAVVVKRYDRFTDPSVTCKLIAPCTDWEYKNFYDIRRYDSSGNLIT